MKITLLIAGQSAYALSAAGLDKEYFVKTMKDFKSGARCVNHETSCLGLHRCRIRGDGRLFRQPEKVIQQ